MRLRDVLHLRRLLLNLPGCAVKSRSTVHDFAVSIYFLGDGGSFYHKFLDVACYYFWCARGRGRLTSSQI